MALPNNLINLIIKFIKDNIFSIIFLIIIILCLATNVKNTIIEANTMNYGTLATGISTTENEMRKKKKAIIKDVKKKCKAEKDKTDCEEVGNEMFIDCEHIEEYNKIKADLNYAEVNNELNGSTWCQWNENKEKCKLGANVEDSIMNLESETHILFEEGNFPNNIADGACTVLNVNASPKKLWAEKLGISIDNIQDPVLTDIANIPLENDKISILDEKGEENVNNIILAFSTALEDKWGDAICPEGIPTTQISWTCPADDKECTLVYETVRHIEERIKDIIKNATEQIDKINNGIGDYTGLNNKKKQKLIDGAETKIDAVNHIKEKIDKTKEDAVAKCSGGAIADITGLSTTP